MTPKPELFGCSHKCEPPTDFPQRASTHTHTLTTKTHASPATLAEVNNIEFIYLFSAPCLSTLVWQGPEKKNRKKRSGSNGPNRMISGSQPPFPGQVLTLLWASPKFFFYRFLAVLRVLGASWPHRRYFLAFFGLFWASLEILAHDLLPSQEHLINKSLRLPTTDH